MIEYIIRHTVNDYTNTTDKKVREQYSIVGGVLGIICNLFLFIGKFLCRHDQWQHRYYFRCLQ